MPRDAVIGYLHKLAEVLGRSPTQTQGDGRIDLTPLDHTQRVAILRVLASKPRVEHVKSLFGSWRDALVAAGLAKEPKRERRKAVEAPPAKAPLDPNYATNRCPYCQKLIHPLPKAKKRCPYCEQPVFVCKAPDGKRHLLRTADLPQMEELWKQYQKNRDAREEAKEEAYRKEEQAMGFLVGDDEVDVVGESHYQNALQRIVGDPPTGGLRYDCAVVLVRELENKYDENAVRVEIEGHTVGYLPSEEAEDFQPLLLQLESQTRTAKCHAEILGGSRGLLGVRLYNLPDPDVM